MQQLIQYLAAFIFYAGVARFITQREAGLWSIPKASTAVFTTPTLLGLPVATQKYVSENYGRGDLGASASISCLTFTIATLFTLLSLTAVLLSSPSLLTLILGGAECTIPLIPVLSASAGATLLAIFWAAILTVIPPLMFSEEERVGKQALPSIYNASSRLLHILILPSAAGLAATVSKAVG